MIDTNVFVAALLSKRGASYKLLMLMDSGKFETNLSVPLIIEYEDVGNRFLHETKLNKRDFRNILDFVCASTTHREIYFLWRPLLKDPKDDMVLELAVAASCEYIVTFNKRHFAGAHVFGIQALMPHEFLSKIGLRK